MNLSSSNMISSIFACHYLGQLRTPRYLIAIIFRNYKLLNVYLSLSSSIMNCSIFACLYLRQLCTPQYLLVIIFVNYKLLNICLSLSLSIMNCSMFACLYPRQLWIAQRSWTTSLQQQKRTTTQSQAQFYTLYYHSSLVMGTVVRKGFNEDVWWLQEGGWVFTEHYRSCLIWWWYRLFVTAAMTVDYDNDGPRMNIEWGNKSTMVIVPTKPYFFLPNLGWIGQKKKSLRSSSEPIMLFQKVER